MAKMNYKLLVNLLNTPSCPALADVSAQLIFSTGSRVQKAYPINTAGLAVELHSCCHN